MRIEQARWTQERGWEPRTPGRLSEAELVLAFGSRDVLKHGAAQRTLRACYPAARIIGGSTAGEILDNQVTDESLVLTAISFQHSGIRSAREALHDGDESFDVGTRLARAIPHENLVHAMVMSEGSVVNGSALVAGLA